jgi:hypothetical protein
MYYDRLDVPSWSYEGHCGWFGSKKSDLPDDIKDHLGRPRKVAPVTTTRHSRFDHLCKGTWLAECSIVHPEGGFILAVSTKVCCRATALSIIALHVVVMLLLYVLCVADCCTV